MDLILMAEAARDRVRSQYTAECKVLRDSGPAGWDPSTGPGTPAPEAVVYEGPCRVHIVERDPRTGDAAGQQATHADYMVGILHDAPAVRVGEVGDVVKLTVCPMDPQLVTRPLKVIGVEFGSLAWERVLTCRDDLIANNPPTS
jgi:hypothetical protein